MFDISIEILEALGFKCIAENEYELDLTDSLSHILLRKTMRVNMELNMVKLDDLTLIHINTDAKLIMFVELIKGI